MGQKQTKNKRKPENMNTYMKLTIFFLRAISIFFLILVATIALSAIMNEGTHSETVRSWLWAYVILIGLTIPFFPKSIMIKAYNYISRNKWVILSVVLLVLISGVVARFGFLLFEYAPKTDPGFFYKSATSLFQTGEIPNPSRFGREPYLYAYTVLLAAVFNITGSNLFGVILLNTIFDLFSALLIGYFIYQLTGSHKWAILSFCLWWISPFNIIFSVLSITYTVVNTLIILIIVLFTNLMKHRSNIMILSGLSVALALALAIKDAIRPISIIMIIAIVIYYLLLTLEERKIKYQYICSIFIIISLFALLGYSWSQVVNAATELPANEYKAGWGIYLGSNYESHGGYSQIDELYMKSLLEEHDGDYSKVYQILQNEGIDRWKELGPAKALEHIKNKTIRFTGNKAQMTYYLPEAYSFIDKSLWDMICTLCGIYWFTLLGFSLYYAYKQNLDKKQKLDAFVFLKILAIGFLLSFMAVEISSRYFTIFFPLFTVFSILGMKYRFEALKIK